VRRREEMHVPHAHIVLSIYSCFIFCPARQSPRATINAARRHWAALGGTGWYWRLPQKNTSQRTTVPADLSRHR
jgi:hypothetical protein